MTEDIQKAGEVLNSIKTKKADFWEQEREKFSLDLFHDAAKNVPAYKKFLKEQKINPETIITLEDFSKVPAVTKKNYLRKYNFSDLNHNGSLNKPLVYTSTSGSTGEPLYFVRDSKLDWNASIWHQFFIDNNIQPEKGPTLIIVAFGMGIWIGGLITYQACEIIGKRGHPLSIITPGINKEEIFKALQKLAPNYHQTIICGYAPFVKDIIDEAEDRKINLKKLKMRFIFAAEAFTENFRDYVATKAGLRNPLIDTTNIYGSAELGTMAMETPLCTLIRRLANKNSDLFHTIFSPIKKTPTLAQFNPQNINFQAQNGELFISGKSAMPLVRYGIGDHGGILTYDKIVSIFKDYKIDLKKEIKKAGIENTISELPFVYVYERIDFSTTLYGLQIYPETIKEILIEKPLSNFLTGKLVLETKYNSRQDQYLEINLEVRKNKVMSAAAKKAALARIVSNLMQKNSEFRELMKFLGKRAYPHLTFWPAEDPLYFKTGIKQKWVKKIS